MSNTQRTTYHRCSDARPAAGQARSGLGGDASGVVEDTPEEQLRASVPDAFEVRDSSSANWVVRRILAARAYSAQVNAWAAAELRRAESEERWLLDRYGAQLRNWLESELSRGSPRRRSVPLPAGVVGIRKLPPKLVVRNEPALLQWCRQHLQGAVRVTATAAGHLAVDLAAWAAGATAIKVQERVSVDELHDYVVETGELPNGVELVRHEERFFIK